jgi:hypothetical protein
MWVMSNRETAVFFALVLALTAMLARAVALW